MDGKIVKDCISRQAAIEALIGITTFKTKHELMQRVNASVQDEQGWLGAVAECLDEIEDLPSAQPERIKGHWVEIASSNHTYKCSVCGRLLVNITDGKNNVAKNYPYCHCGADMRGEQE